MTDLRETVSAAILKVMREDGQFGTLAFADAAIAAMQPTLDQLARERDDALSFLDNAVSDAPEPLLRLGEYLADLLDEDRWPTAERYLNAAVKSVDEAKRQRDAALDALTSVLAACDTGRMVSRGAGGMTLEAQIQRSVLNGVPAWPIEKAREALAEINAVEGDGR